MFKVSIRVQHGRKCRGSRWNWVDGSSVQYAYSYFHVLPDITLLTAILNFGSRTTMENVRSDTAMSVMVELLHSHS